MPTRRPLLIAAIVLSGCQPSPAPEQYASPAELRCRYEVMAAYAGARERTVGDMFYNAVAQQNLMQACLAAQAAASPVSVAPRSGTPASATTVSSGYCSDPSVTNPALLAECEAARRDAASPPPPARPRVGR